MTITVIGTGFVGVVTSAVFASFDNKTYGLDIDERKIDLLKQGEVPFFEPGLEDMIRKGMASGNLEFTTDYEKAVKDAEVIMIAVGTPSKEDGTADLTYVLAAAKSAAPHLKPGAIVAVKSTVPPGTNDKVSQVIREETDTKFYVASLPEFLKEGTAVHDTLHPDRVVIGATETEVIDRLMKLHEPLEGERAVVRPESAQMAKYTANAYLAQRITFINQIANLCEKNGASINEVVEVIGLDRRIGSHYWYPGLGYGGSCFPKDVKELAAYARSIGEGDGLLVKIDQLNERRITKKLDAMNEMIGLGGRTVAVLGLSFKPNTNDMREAPSLKVIDYLKENGATIRAYDPETMEEAKKRWPDIYYGRDAYDASKGASVIILLVEWQELIELDLNKMTANESGERWFVDTRNQYPRNEVEKAGYKYIGIGNP